MSATLDVSTFEVYFKENYPPRLHIPGRMYDVTIVYSRAPVANYINEHIDQAVAIHREEAVGDILVFLTGEHEIDRAVARITRLCEETRCIGAPGVTGALVLPLFGSLAIEDQTRVFDKVPPNIRKIICATNIAETSLTIDGVVFVVDCGYHKQSLFNTESRVDCLLPAVISKASAMQRAGRAGRTKPGKCFRLMTIDDYERELPMESFPEITRCDVSSTILYILRLGFKNPFSFPFITPPPSGSFISAFMLLDFLGAMTGEGVITDLGRQIVEVPSSPMYARALVRSSKFGCSADVAVVVAMIEAGNVFMRGRNRDISAAVNSKFTHPHGDHLTLFNIFQAFIKNNRSSQWCRDHCLKYTVLNRAVSVYDQLLNIMDRLKIPRLSTYRPLPHSSTSLGTAIAGRPQYHIEANANNSVLDSTAIRRALAEGLFVHVAYLSANSRYYKPIRESLTLHLPQSSGLCTARQQWVMYDRLEVQAGFDGVLINLATAVDPEYLIDINREYFDPSEVPHDDVKAQVINLMKLQ